MAGASKMVPFISEGGRNISAACVKAFQKAPQSSVMQNCHFGNSTAEAMAMADGGSIIKQ